MLEKEMTLIDFLKKVAPGTALRTTMDDILRSKLGALIVFDAQGLDSIMEGGFRVNCRFTSQRLFELCKMDGAVIVSSDLKRILYANVMLLPDSTILTNETGTRHKSGERAAKQFNTFVIAISERKAKTTLYLPKAKYFLKDAGELLREVSTALQVLEKQREIFNDLLGKLNILEMSELVSISDVCMAIQRAEMILKISEAIKRDFIELGKESNIMNMRYKELLRGINKIEDEIIRDYSSTTLKRTKTQLSNLSYDDLLDLNSVSKALTSGMTLEENISTRGFRFLSHLKLKEKESSQIVKQFGSLGKIFGASVEEFESFFKEDASRIKTDIDSLREKILSGKVI
ncbi:MAG: DNA integrity scanning diadenylate cyclase DisA [Nanoarchaeota archaeon]|nr:DNA integrity scanning diadenylate cyclase DisA [Nanoarchaeota archaeon]